MARSKRSTRCSRVSLHCQRQQACLSFRAIIRQTMWHSTLSTKTLTMCNRQLRNSNNARGKRIKNRLRTSERSPILSKPQITSLTRAGLLWAQSPRHKPNLRFLRVHLEAKHRCLTTWNLQKSRQKSFQEAPARPIWKTFNSWRVLEKLKATITIITMATWWIMWIQHQLQLCSRQQPIKSVTLNQRQHSQDCNSHGPIWPRLLHSRQVGEIRGRGRSPISESLTSMTVTKHNRLKKMIVTELLERKRCLSKNELKPLTPSSKDKSDRKANDSSALSPWKRRFLSLKLNLMSKARQCNKEKDRKAQRNIRYLEDLNFKSMPQVMETVLINQDK